MKAVVLAKVHNIVSMIFIIEHSSKVKCNFRERVCGLQESLEGEHGSSFSSFVSRDHAFAFSDCI
jgi:hypothetical protein